MSNLYVQEFAGLANSGDGGVPVIAQPPLASYVVASTTVAVAGAAYQPGTKFVQIQADGIGSVRFDGTVATATDQRLIANGQPVIYGVGSLAGKNVSFIINT